MAASPNRVTDIAEIRRNAGSPVPFERELTEVVDGQPALVRPRLRPVPVHRREPAEHPLPASRRGMRAMDLVAADVAELRGQVTSLSGEVSELRQVLGTLADLTDDARIAAQRAEAAAGARETEVTNAQVITRLQQLLNETEEEIERWPEPPALDARNAASAAPPAPAPDELRERLDELKARVARLGAGAATASRPVPAAFTSAFPLPAATPEPPAPAALRSAVTLPGRGIVPGVTPPAGPPAKAPAPKVDEESDDPASSIALIGPAPPPGALVPALPAVHPGLTPRLRPRTQRRRVRRPATGPRREMARELFSRGQLAFGAVVAALVAGGLVVSPVNTARAFILVVVLFWTALLGVKVRLAIASRAGGQERQRVADPTDHDLPSFTVLVPLYREANMIRGLRDALGRLQYPAGKVQTLLLLEAHDEETIAAAVEHGVPHLVVPPGGPQNKPNALNFGLAQATGDFTVIYDAEDRPEPDQLLKFVATFQDSAPEVACVQARLAFWNGSSSWVARFYWVEYVIHFEWVLRGLARLHLVPPLGGTSNCFRTSVLRDIAFAPEEMPFAQEYTGAWDPWNVTEDADLAGALALQGYDVVMTDSVTLEEATSHLRIALGQRSRWLKGYLHTGLVYTRHPVAMARAMSPRRYAIYILLMLGTPLSILLTPIFWVLTVVYFVTRSSFIESLYPAPVLYLGVLLMLGGNLFVFYQRVWACIHRRSDGGVKVMLLSPAWEAFGVVVLARVLNELARKSKRHRWVKTEHGHDSAHEPVVVSADR